MKKRKVRVLCGITAASMLFTCLPLNTFFANASAIKLGDVNADGKINAADVAAVDEILGQGVETIFVEDTDTEKISADVNRDYMLDGADLAMLERFVNGELESFPTEFNGITDETISMSLTDGSCFAGDSMEVDLSFVDWTKDIAAYDMIVRIPKGFTVEEVNHTEGCHYVLKNNVLKLYGSFKDKEKARGKVATLKLKADFELSGAYDLFVDAANVYTSEQTFYTTQTACSTLMVCEVLNPVSLKADGVSSKSVSLKWKMPFAQNPVVAYHVYRDEKMIAETAETAYIDNELETGREYSYTVRALDDAGNETEDSVPFVIAPTAVSIKSASFSDNVIGYQNAELTTVLQQLSLLDSAIIRLYDANQKAVLEETVPFHGNAMESFSHQLDLSKIESGIYTAEIVVVDIDGAESSESMEIEVNTTQPSAVTLTAYAGGGYSKLTWGIALEPEVEGYHIYRAASGSSEFEQIASVEGRSVLDFTDSCLEEGTSWKYYVTAVTKYGLEGIPSNIETLTVEKDDVIPEIVYFQPANGKRVHGELNFSVKASDDNKVSSVEILWSDESGEAWTSLYQKEAENGSWVFNTTEFADGIYQFKAIAKDYAGNESNGTNVIRLLIDNTAPEKVTNLALEELFATKATISWNDVADEDFDHFNILVTKNGQTSTYTVKDKMGINLSDLSVNTRYTVNVAAVDLVGNVGAYSEAMQFTTPADVSAPVITTFNCDAAYIKDNTVFSCYVCCSDETDIYSYNLEYSQDGENWTSLGTFYSNYYNKKYCDISTSVSKLSDGPVYLRVTAKDIYSNITASEDAPVLTITADNTKPDAVPNLTATQGKNYIELKWDSPEEGTIKKFLIQRAVGEDETFSNLKGMSDNYAYLNYRDSAVEREQTYRYRVAAVDAAGNVGEFCDPVEITCSPDTESPVITEIKLIGKPAVCEAYHTIYIHAADNSEIDSVFAQYSLNNGKTWNEGTLELYDQTKTDVIYNMTLPEEAYSAESVLVRASATDTYSNTSEVAEASFVVDNSFTEITEIIAENDNNEITISWECEDIENTTIFYVYRSINGEEEFALKGIYPAAGTTSYSFTDKSSKVTGSYQYSVAAVRTNGNKTRKFADVLDITALPLAILNCDKSQQIGAAYYFDATLSEPSEEITSVVIDYGDGTANSASNVAAARFKHIYEKEGVYEVVLTCTNEKGGSSVTKTYVTVEDISQLANVTVSVKTTDGKNAEGASVYVDVGTAEQSVYTADKYGRVSFVTKAGTHEIGVLGSNYLPVTKSCIVYAGAANTINFSVVEQPLVSASFDVQRMTLAEIQAAGIDVADPANSHIVSINIKLSYDGEKKEQSIRIPYDTTTGVHYLTDSLRNEGYTLYNVHTNAKNEIDAVVLMQIPTKVSILKEFFKVNMMVINNAATEYTLTNCYTTLNVPDGLTVMEDAAGYASKSTTILDIPGQSSQTVSWCVRGDKEGTYSVSADFSAKLSKFNEDIQTSFESDQKITVNGTSALNVEVNIDNTIVKDTMYLEMRVKNVSANPVHMVSTDANDFLVQMQESGVEIGTPDVMIAQTRFIGKDGILKVLEEKTDQRETLNSGEIFSVLYAIRNFSDEYAFGYLKGMEETLKYTVSGGAKVSVNLVSNLHPTDTNSLFYGISFDPETQYMFVFRNKANKPLANTEVSIQKFISPTYSAYFTGITDEKGRIIVNRDTNGGTYKITAAAEGYKNYTQYGYHFPTRSTDKYEIIKLNGNVDEMNLEPSAVNLYEDSVYKANVLRRQYNCTEVDLKELSLHISNGSDAVRYELVQNGNVIKRANVVEGSNITEIDGIRGISLNPAQKISLICYAATGDFITLDTQINVKEDPEKLANIGADDLKKELLKDTDPVSTQLPYSWDIVGGKQITLSFPSYLGTSAEVTFTENKFSIEINGEKQDEGGKEYFTFKEPKKLKIGKAQISVAIGAAFEGELDTDTGDISVTGKIYVTFSGGGEVFAAQVAVYPFYCSVDVTISLEAGFQIKYGTQTGFSGTGIYISPSIELELSGMIGYADIIGIGAYGSGEISADIPILPHLGCDSITASAELGAKLEFFAWETKYPIAQGEFKILSNPVRAFSKSEALSYGITSSEYATLYRSVLGEEYDETNPKELMVTLDNFFTILDSETETPAENAALTDSDIMTKIGTDSTYSSNPIICTDGVHTVMTWVTRDINRGINNASCLVYSVYDAESKTWSSPKAVDSNQNADYYPTLFAASDGIHIAYLESEAVYADSEELKIAEYTEQIQIESAVFNPESGCFENLSVVETGLEKGYPSNLQFAEDGEKNLYLFWSATNGEDLFGMNGENAIYYAGYHAEGISEAVLLQKDLPMLGGFACETDENGAVQVAYVVNGSADTIDVTNRKLLKSDLIGNTMEIAEGTISKIKVGANPLTGKQSFLWMQGKTLCGVSEGAPVVIFDGSNYELTNEYLTTENAVYFLVQCKNSTALYTTLYENGENTPPVVADQQENLYYRSLCGVTLNGEDLISMVGEVITDSDSVSTVYSGTANHLTDLILQETAYSSANAKEDAEFPIAFSVTNAGTETVESFIAVLSDSEGKVVAQQKMDAVLFSGTTEKFSFTTILPDVDGAVSYQLTVQTEQTDRTPDNNSSSIDLTKTDLSVETSLYYDEDTTQVAILITNHSNVVANAVIKGTTQSNQSENVSMLVKSIAPHSSRVLTIEASDLLGGVYHDFVDISILSDVEDSNEENNMTTITLTNGGFMARILGDANFDGCVDSSDAVLALKMFNAIIMDDTSEYTAVQLETANCDGIDSVDSSDAVWILKYCNYCMMNEENTVTMEEFIKNEMEGVN